MKKITEIRIIYEYIPFKTNQTKEYNKHSLNHGQNIFSPEFCCSKEVLNPTKVI